ncbi:hypothetical protein ACF0H5_008625 [Mactra antiquata]
MSHRSRQINIVIPLLSFILQDALEKSETKEGSKNLRDNPSLRHLGDVLPFLPQFYTNDFGRDILSDIKAASNEPDPPPVVPETSPKPGVELVIPSLATPSKQKKESTVANGKKGYSDDDLSAAVSEVRNGKLGTRRASSLYGVPRSTLRNKVFKMESGEPNSSGFLGEEEEGSSNEAPPSIKQQPHLNTQDRPLMLHDLLQLSTLHYLAPIAIPYYIKPDMFTIPQPEEMEWEKKLQTVRHKHNLNKASMHHYKVKALTHHKLKPFQYDLIRKLTKERLDIERNNIKGKFPGGQDVQDLSLSHLEFLKSLELASATQPPSNKKVKKEVMDSIMDANTAMQSALYKALNVNPFSSSGGARENSSPDSDITVPDVSSKTSHKDEVAYPSSHSKDRKMYDGLFKYENTRIGDTLKDIIVKTISEKVKCKLESTDFSGLVGTKSSLENQKAKDTIMSAFSVPECSSPPKKAKREPSVLEVSRLNTRQNTSSNNTPVKKTRPKRGQYRKYNSQLLTEAVKAVQRGEMSVHRAGSYYGVPHSTLEYKVKERHLLRQKKIKEQQEQKLKAEAEAASNSATTSSSKKEKPSVELEKASKTPKESKKLMESLEQALTSKDALHQGPSWLPSFGGQVPYESAAALGFFGTNFSLNTPASELLRKLQHKVQSKSESGDELSPSSPSTEGYIYIN